MPRPLSGLATTVITFNSLFEMRNWTAGFAVGRGCTIPFNSLFEMLGVLEIGFSGFLSFVGGGMWVLCGGLVGCVILVLSFCRCVECGDVCICVFLRLGVGVR